MKKVVKLNEKELNRMISESVKRCLNEMSQEEFMSQEEYAKEGTFIKEGPFAQVIADIEKIFRQLGFELEQYLHSQGLPEDELYWWYTKIFGPMHSMVVGINGLTRRINGRPEERGQIISSCRYKLRPEQFR